MHLKEFHSNVKLEQFPKYILFCKPLGAGTNKHEGQDSWLPSLSLQG